jgi:hypothetical protein
MSMGTRLLRGATRKFGGSRFAGTPLMGEKIVVHPAKIGRKTIPSSAGRKILRRFAPPRA